MARARATSEATPSRRRKILRIAGIFAGVLGVLLIAALFALHSSPARRAVLSQVTKLLAAQHIELSTDELRYNLFNLSLSLRNVRVRSPEMPEPPFATIARARIDLSLLQLLRGRYVVESGAAEGFAIHYVVEAGGRDNLPRPPRDPDQPSEPLDYLIDDLELTDAHVRYENRAQRIDLVLPISSINVTGNALTDRHDIELASAGGHLQQQDRTLRLDRLAGEIDLGREDVKFERLDLDSEGSRLALTGTISDFDAPQSDLQLRGTLDAARAALLAGVKDPVAGTIQLDATAKGDLSAPAVAGQISGSGLRFRNVDGGQLTATAAYDPARKHASVSALQLRAPWGSISAEGSVALEGTAESRVRADVTSLDAAALMRALGTPYVAATRIDARVQASWPGLDYLKATGDAKAALTPTATRVTRSVIPVGGNVGIQARDRRIVADLRGLRAAGADLNGRVTLVDERRLAGTVRTRITDVNRAVASAEAFLGRPRGSLLPTTVSGPANLDARIAGTIQSPSVTAGLVAPSLTIGDAPAIGLTGDLRYAPAAINIDRLDLEWQQAQAHLAGRVGLQGSRSLDLTFAADALGIPELLRAAKQDIPASGTLSMHGAVTGTLTRPLASVVVRGSDLAAYGETLGSLTASAAINGPEATLSEFVLDKPQPERNGRLWANGNYHLDRRSYTFYIGSENVRLLGAALPDGRVLRGEVELAARGAGSVTSPAADIELAIGSLRVGEYDLGRVVAKSNIANQQATVVTTAERFHVDANAVVGISRPYPAKVKLLVRDLELAALPLKLQTPLEGQLRATIDASGDLTEPARGRADATIEAFHGAWHEKPFSIDAPAVLRYANERLAIEQLRLKAEDSTAVIRGELPLTDRAGEGVIDVEAHANLATLFQYAPAGTNVSGDGAVALTGTIRGTLKAIDPDLVISIDDGLLLSPTLEPGVSNLQLRARVAGGEVNIEQLGGNWGTATIAAAGRIPLEAVPQLPVEIPRKGGPATFEAKLTGLNPAAIPGAPSGLSGRISMDAKFAATRAELGSLEGQMTFPELQVGFNNLTLQQQQPSLIGIQGGVASIQQFNLAGSVGTLGATGSVGLVGARAIDVRADGNLNIGVVSLFTDAVRAEGATTLQIAARGTLDAPELNGTVDLPDGVVVIDEPNIAAEHVVARVDLNGRHVSLTRLTADVNGGTMKGAGTIELGEGGISDIDLQFSTDDFAFDAPLELRSLSDSNIRISRRADEFVIDGQVTIDEAGLTGDINFDTGLLAAMTARRKLDLTEERNPFLERVRFNIDVDTATPILVDNNLARAEVTTDVRVLGTPYQTGLTGQLRLLEGSEITLNERRFEVERGTITFTDERRIFPSFDLLLNTSVRTYDISINVTGVPGETETTLTSDPMLPEPDIMAMLVTGRTLDEMRGEEFEVAREQVMSYLAGRVGSRLGRGLERATGLSEVRIEPNLIANEADPNARLTVGQELTRDLKLVYSTNLIDSNDQIWVAEYDVTRRFQSKVVRQSDNSYRTDFRHDVRFGGRREPRQLPRHRPTVASVQITGTQAISDTGLRQLFDVEEGQPHDFFAVRRGVTRIEEALRERGWLQSRVRVQREVDQDTVRLALNVTPGPVVDIRFEGLTPPEKVLEEVRLQWQRGVFDQQRADDSAEAIRGWLQRENHLQAKVEHAIQDVSPDRRQATFAVEPGPRFQSVVLAFQGASGIDPKELDDIINEQDLELQLFTDPVVVTELLERYYREQGYLAAEIDEPRYEYTGSVARVVLEVHEGPRFMIRQVSTTGNTVFATPALIRELPVVAGDPFLPAAAENSLDRIRDLYWGRGYNDVGSDYELVINRDLGIVDVAFTLTEGLQSVVADIAVEGNEKTSDRLVREQLDLDTDQPLDLTALGRSRRNLYDTGAFSVVDVTRQDLAGDAPANTGGATGSTQAEAKPVRINVNVREVQPFQVRYGASYDTERGVGGIFDLSNHNSLGKARVVGVRSRYDGQFREVRAYINQPSLRYWPIEMTGNVYYNEAHNASTETTDALNIERRGFSIQGETKLRDSYVWSYGYRYERAHSFDPAPDGLLDETTTVAPLTTTFTRETRDDVLDATTGSFMAQAFSFSPEWLGSGLPYVRYLGQYFHYFPLQPPQRRRFTNEILRPRLVFATGVRVGLARGIGGVVPTSERFFAGGSTTLRGFAQNAVGPIGLDLVPTGGDALLVINNELRFPLVSIVDGVVFADVGNVFRRVSDFSFTDLRESAGVGVRLRTPWFLIRGDYGFVLDHRPGERRSRFYFSIGQAF